MLWKNWLFNRQGVGKVFLRGNFFKLSQGLNSWDNLYFETYVLLKQNNGKNFTNSTDFGIAKETKEPTHPHQNCIGAKKSDHVMYTDSHKRKPKPKLLPYPISTPNYSFS